jgi:7,8-dihydropterin-6-yl-methyl-4-(beta-D-ribofuranosyl)aminobenzene 5'-phosphate synthase
MQDKGQTIEEKYQADSSPTSDDLTIKVVHDNNRYADGLETAWGFSALITGTNKTILFDAGSDGWLLLNNMKKLAIEPNDIDVMVLSHLHGDHSGGAGGLLEKNSRVTVYLPISFPKKSKQRVRELAAKVVEVKEPTKICERVHSTGQLGRLIHEHSLIIQTQRGSIVMTGCAHPGIINTVNTARDLVKGNILLVMGGFHLEWATKRKIEKIISAFKQWPVQYVGPCHCSGHKARTLFEKRYGERYIKVGAGRVITIGNLQ